MAFLKIEKKTSGSYLRIVESYREDGKTKHKTLHSLGKVEDYTPEQLRSIGLKLYELGGGDLKNLLNGSFEELDRINYGFVQVYSKALRYYKLDSVLTKIAKKHLLQFNLLDTTLLMAIERLNDPCSKRQNYVNQLEYIGLDTMYAQHFYRTLDKLDQYSDLIQKQIYDTGRNLFNNQLDVVFYDVTTLYFESQSQSDEENKILRRKGFSKDGKVGDTQILFTMLIDKDKNPIGYEVFEGNKYEGHTLETAIERLKKKYNIRKIIIVADRGLLNTKNLERVVESKFEFIIGDRLKKMPKHLQDYFTDIQNYKKEFNISEGSDTMSIKYCFKEYKDRKIIATYSEKRAKKDKFDREEKLKTAKKLLENPELISKKANQFFLKKTEKDAYELDQVKIKNNERFDGFLTIATNAKDITEIEAIEQYKQLYKIEQTFRVFKNYLETRPMYHWTDKRIRGHICLCYIAYTLLNWVKQSISKHNLNLSENDLRNILSKMQLSLVQHNDKKIFLRSKQQPFELKLLQCLAIKPLTPLISDTNIDKLMR